MDRPTDVHTLQIFLGMAVYFSAFIPYYSDRCGALFRKLRKNHKWEWGPDKEEVFLSIKHALKNAPVLGHPVQGSPYRLYTDASDLALGCALQQVQLTKMSDLKGNKAYEQIRLAYSQSQPVLRHSTSSGFSQVP